MGASAKIWGIGAVAALAIAGYFLMQPAGPIAEPELADATPAAPPATISEPEATDEPALQADTAEPTPEAETAQSAAILADAGVAFPEPKSDPTSNEAATTAAPEIPAETQTPMPEAEASPEVANAGSEIASAAEAAPEAAATEEPADAGPAPEVATGLEIALHAPTPDPVLPATATAIEPAQGMAPNAASEAAGTLAQETTPQLGEASAPLTLAQVLPPDQAPAPNQIAPSFDLVRVSPDGSAVIAGRAAPGANVQLFSGTIPVAEVTASARGEFVVFLDAPSATTLDLQIPATPEGAQLVVSQDDIIILPPAPDAEGIAPTVLHRTPDAVQIIQPAGPAIPSNISLDLVSYSESGAVQLAGRGLPGNVARIYTDGRLAGEAPIAGGGNWALEISDIAEGRYVLRVDEIAPTGEVLSRTESPFQRQFPEANMPDSFSQGAKIIVQPGNTLWLMATEAYGDGDAYSQIFSANKDAIRDPDLIYPGQIFSIPRIEE